MTHWVLFRNYYDQEYWYCRYLLGFYYNIATQASKVLLCTWYTKYRQQSRPIVKCQDKDSPLQLVSVLVDAMAMLYR